MPGGAGWYRTAAGWGVALTLLSGCASDAQPLAGAQTPGVSIIRGDPSASEWWDLTIRDSTLADLEGKWLFVRVGMPERPPERLGSGQARVVAGSVELALPQVWEAFTYKRKLAYIDVDDDGVCDATVDRLFFDARAVPDLVLALHSDASSRSYMSPSFAPEDCAVFNADWPIQ